MTYISFTIIFTLLLYARHIRRLHERDEDMRVWVARRYPKVERDNGRG